jgi:hypothetical protein
VEGNRVAGGDAYLKYADVIILQKNAVVLRRGDDGIEG